MDNALDKIVLITAIINAVGIILLFFTCRFIPIFHLTNRLSSRDWYKQVYKYHLYIWFILVPSAAVHAIIAIARVLMGG
jgi:hypothetical protein